VAGRPPRGSASDALSEHPIWRGLADRPRHGSWGRYQDPVFGYISLAPLLRQALDLKLVQRLRGIKQLSGLDLIFPGASHTRFEHSVGVMWLAREAHEVLEQKALAHQDWPRLSIATQLAVMLGGLFHDLGHGPYSHTYEMFLEREADPADREGDGEMTNGKHPQPHMKATRRIILQDPDIGTFLRQIGARLREAGQEPAGLVDPEQVARIAISDPLTGDYAPYSFLGQMISGEFDVDRLDYLRRDAVHTGVPMGLDTMEIVAAYTLARVSIEEPTYEEPSGATVDAVPAGAEPEGELRWQLKLDRVASEAFEGMLIARDTAYRRLYYQRAHRSGQEMLILALQRLTRRLPEPPTAAGGETIPPAALADKDDQELLAMFEKYSDRDSLLRVLYQSWKRRQLYEPLPHAIRIHGWPDDVRLRLEGQLRLKANRVLREKMRDAAAAVGMQLENDDPATAENHPPERILVDITKVPVSSADAYRGRWLWDERDGQLVWETREDAEGKKTNVVRRVGFALNELLPHMNALHGRLKDGRNAHRDYTAQMQTILIFVPGSFMKRLHEEIVDERNASRANVAEYVYGRRLGPILAQLHAALTTGIDAPPDQTALFGNMKDELLRWLDSDQAFPNDGEREVWAPFP
jgi:HD superfamily phosphohydrolase